METLWNKCSTIVTTDEIQRPWKHDTDYRHGKEQNEKMKSGSQSPEYFNHDALLVNPTPWKMGIQTYNPIDT
jgi:hypothetical protein